MKIKLLIIVVVILFVLGGITLSSKSDLRELGTEAPDFLATLGNGERISLRDYRNKKHVVLVFYPRDFTSGCTKQVCSFRDNYAELLKYDAVVFGVSFDGDSSHSAFIEMHQLPFPLISDADKSISVAFGASPRLGGLLPGAKRVTYVIDKGGIIRGVLHHEIFVGKHVEGVLEVLQKLGTDGS